MMWLEEFHINKYVRKYDARTEGRYLKPPEFDRLKIGDKVFVGPRGRYKFYVPRRFIGQYGVVEEVGERSSIHGRLVKVRLNVTGEEISYREVAFRLVKT